MSAPDQAEISRRLEAAVTAMTKLENRYDVTIICTTDDHQANFWMSKLGKTEKEGEFPVVIAVSEDWGGSGAGNGLGTLYAWQKAAEYAKENLNGLDLTAKLGDGSISAALYHTAGKGTRLAPLPASENNNKPGVVRSLMDDALYCMLCVCVSTRRFIPDSQCFKTKKMRVSTELVSCLFFFCSL